MKKPKLRQINQLKAPFKNFQICKNKSHKLKSYRISPVKTWLKIIKTIILN